MIDNGHELVRFLPVCPIPKQLREEGSGDDKEMSVYLFISTMMVLLESNVRATADNVM